MVKRQTSLSANIIAFCRYLRKYDFNIGPSEEKDALLAIQYINPFDTPNSLQLCLQIALCRSPKQLNLFPKLFQHYWQELDRAVESKLKEQAEEKKVKKTKQKNQAPNLQTLKNWLYGNKNKEILKTATYSESGMGNAGEQIEFSQQELKEVFQLIQKLVKKIANRRSRRFKSSQKKATLDLKKSIRKNILKNGEIINIFYKKKKKEQLKVVLLCDVSRSMELYSRFFIQFMFAFQSLFPKVEAFAFATTLHHISKELHKTSIDKSLKEIIQKIPDWSSGTKIGTALSEFNQNFSHKYLGSKTLVIILSDGWDTDELDMVGENMKRIHRKALKVLWLNPLAGSIDWQPTVRGMQAALPYIDTLLPFYNLESLREMVRKLRF